MIRAAKRVLYAAVVSAAVGLCGVEYFVFKQAPPIHDLLLGVSRHVGDQGGAPQTAKSQPAAPTVAAMAGGPRDAADFERSTATSKPPRGPAT